MDIRTSKYSPTLSHQLHILIHHVVEKPFTFNQKVSLQIILVCTLSAPFKPFLKLLISLHLDSQQSSHLHLPGYNGADLHRRLVSSFSKCSMKDMLLMKPRGEGFGHHRWRCRWICRRHQSWTRGNEGMDRTYSYVLGHS